MSIENANKAANDLLKKLEIKTLPIKIEEVAKILGLKVVGWAFDDDISGTLIIKESVIGFNQTESRVRRRFTIAHELGHYILHKTEKSIFLDKLFRFNYPNPDQNTKFEMEANAFAAAILMPEGLIRKETKNLEFDLGDELSIKYLAKKFDVSTTAMYYRLLNLQLMTPH